MTRKVTISTGKTILVENLNEASQIHIQKKFKLNIRIYSTYYVIILKDSVIIRLNLKKINLLRNNVRIELFEKRFCIATLQ